MARLEKITIYKYIKTSSLPLKKSLEELKKRGIDCNKETLINERSRKILVNLHKSIVKNKSIENFNITHSQTKDEVQLSKIGITNSEYLKLATFTSKKLNDFYLNGLNDDEKIFIKKLRTLKIIQHSVKKELIRLENLINRPRYFIFGLTKQIETQKSLIISYKSIPERAITDASYNENNPFIFKVGDLYLEASMQLKDGELEIEFLYENIKNSIEISILNEITKYGIYYVMDSRGYINNILKFLRRNHSNNILLDAILNNVKNIELNLKEPFFDFLNQAQNHAVIKAINQNLSFVWGPPGTGKTTTMAALAALLVKNGYRVLLSAPSNNALDQLLFSTYTKLNTNAFITRLGFTSHKICKEFTKWNFAKMKKEMHIPKSYYDWNEFVIDSSIVAGNFAQLAISSVDSIGKFDFVLIDEVSMSNAPVLIIPAYYAKKSIVLGGDPHQLPPPYSEDSEQPNDWFSENIFEKSSIKSVDDERVSFLDIQYRMQPEIGNLVSDLFYDGLIKSAQKNSNSNNSKIIFLHCDSTVNTNVTQYSYTENNMRHNENHAILVTKAIEMSFLNGFIASEIGVIAPYNAQISCIKDKIFQMTTDGIISDTQNEEIKVSTVHSFQGQEKRVIIIDFTDSNIEPTPLTAKKNLINVALSRAQDQLIIIGNKDYLLNESFFDKNEITIFRTILSNCKIINSSELFK